MCWGVWSNGIKYLFLKKTPPFLSWICLQIQESATNDVLISIYCFKKRHFIPDSQGVIAKELSLVRALQIHPVVWYSDEIPLHYYYYYYICASIECVFIGIGILVLVLVLVLESGIECWLWSSQSFSLYAQFLSHLVLKEVKEFCLDLSNRQAAEFFLFTLRGDCEGPLL